MLKIGLECKVFCYKGSDSSAVEVGIDIPLSDCILRDFTFYNIDYISICLEDSRYTTIGSNCDDFVVNERYEQIKDRLEVLNVLGYN